MSEGNGDRLSTIPPPPTRRISVPSLEYARADATEGERARIHANNVMAIEAALGSIADALESQGAMLTLIWQELRNQRQ